MYTRRPKESHRDTVAYEIDMLGFCARRVMRDEHADQRDQSVYLEAFLLHFRNLIRFLSGEQHRADDLSTANPTVWADRELTQAEVAAITNPAKALDTKYHQSISKYLQHCTRLRFDHDRAWDLTLMLQEITPVITAFEHAFPG
jgi:hypothetical protein